MSRALEDILFGDLGPRERTLTRAASVATAATPSARPKPAQPVAAQTALSTPAT
jgi:hypothetical protein